MTGTIEADIFIPWAREAVFPFLVDAALAAEWLGGVHSLDARPGGALRIETPFDGLFDGRFVAVSPPDRISFGWERAALAGSPVERAEDVEIELTPRYGGTLVVVRIGEPPAGGSPSGPRDPPAGHRSGDVSRDPHVLFWKHALAKLYAAVMRGGPAGRSRQAPA